MEASKRKVNCLMFISVNAADGGLSRSAKTGTGQNRWRGSMSGCPPETHGSSLWAEKGDRGLKFHSLSMSHLNQLSNAFSLE